MLDLMGELHKDNSGYDLKHLFIGAEGTLGVITAAVMRLVAQPAAQATATLALRGLADALGLLRRLQAATGGAVEAFEYMSPSYMRELARHRPDIRQPFDSIAPCTILVEVAAPTPEAAEAHGDGRRPLDRLLEEALAAMLADGTLIDAEIAGSVAQRRAMWQRRELAAEVMFARKPHIDTDVALPLDRVADFLTAIEPRLAALDPGAEPMAIAHLGDGNIHFTVYPGRDDPALADDVIEIVEELVVGMGGSFSAEHGIGLSKLPSMARRKNPAALDVMRAVKVALDPGNLMNPGKVIPA
jgi:FAD/FMN-containing dehydrogenase